MFEGTGHYCKLSLVRHKINQLNSLTKYDKMKIATNSAQIQCMVDLDIITPEEASVTLDMYRRLEQAHEREKAKRNKPKVR